MVRPPLIPKEDNTSEILRAEILKNNFLYKRQEVQKDAVPTAYRNNKELAISRLEKEETELVTDLNVALQKSKLREDLKHQKNIMHLQKRLAQELERLKELRKTNLELNVEIQRVQKKELSDWLKNEHIARKMSSKPRKIFGDIMGQFASKASRYNNALEKQITFRYEFESLMKEMSQKKEVYEKLMGRLNKEKKVVRDVADHAMRAYKDRQESSNHLQKYKETAAAQKVKLEEKVLLTANHFQKEYKLTNFIIQKSKRINSKDCQIRSNNEEVDEHVRKIRQGNTNFLEYISKLGGEKDLKSITKQIKRVVVDKDSLFGVVLFLINQVDRMEALIKQRRTLARASKHQTEENEKSNDKQLDEWMKTVRCNGKRLKEIDDSVRSKAKAYREVCAKLNHLCDMLNINRARMERMLGTNDQPSEDNVAVFFEEMEKACNHVLYVVNCVENNCVSEKYEESLSSDADSTYGLIAKDHDGIEIKKGRTIVMEDPSMLPLQAKHLNPGYIASPCPICMENRFMDDDDYTILRLNEMEIVETTCSQLKRPLGVCRPELIRYRDFENLGLEVAATMHEKADCVFSTSQQVPGKRDRS